MTETTQTAQLWTFRDGLLGFEDIKEYRYEEQPDSPFRSLTALGRGEISFIIMNAYDIRPDYDLKIVEDDLKSLGLPPNESPACFLIITIPDDPRDMTANFLGPVIVNRKTGAAKQMISLNTRYTTRHKVLDEIQRDED